MIVARQLIPMCLHLGKVITSYRFIYRPRSSAAGPGWIASGAGCLRQPKPIVEGTGNPFPRVPSAIVGQNMPDILTGELGH